LLSLYALFYFPRLLAGGEAGGMAARASGVTFIWSHSLCREGNVSC